MIRVVSMMSSHNKFHFCLVVLVICRSTAVSMPAVTMWMTDCDYYFDYYTSVASVADCKAKCRLSCRSVMIIVTMIMITNDD